MENVLHYVLTVGAVSLAFMGLIGSVTGFLAGIGAFGFAIEEAATRNKALAYFAFGMALWFIAVPVCVVTLAYYGPIAKQMIEAMP